MTICCVVGVAAATVIAFIILIILDPVLALALFGTAIGLALLVFVVLGFWARKHHRTPTTLLPTSAQQAGDASDIPSAPVANPPAFTLDDGGENRKVLRRPPPAVMQGRDNHGSYLGRPVTTVMQGIDNRGSYLGRPATHSESSTLQPMYRDGADR
jgi:hypothetical protein